MADFKTYVNSVLLLFSRSENPKNVVANFIEFPFSSGLRNDHQPETFSLKHKIDGNDFPSKFIKIGKLSPLHRSIL